MSTDNVQGIMNQASTNDIKIGISNVPARTGRRIDGRRCSLHEIIEAKKLLDESIPIKIGEAE